MFSPKNLARKGLRQLWWLCYGLGTQNWCYIPVCRTYISEKINDHNKSFSAKMNWLDKIEMNHYYGDETVIGQLLWFEML